MHNQNLKIVELTDQLWQPANRLDFPMLVAVSGGADSVAMLRILAARAQTQQSGNVILKVAHVNHGTRGADSDADETFVQDLAASLELDFHVARISATENASSTSALPSEAHLRQLRYDALLTIAHETGARYLATGHTRDDHVETVLFRILRGTGLAGLAGIPPLRVIDDTVSIIRPLLNFSRREIESLLTELRQDFRIDGSNINQAYKRNYLRLQLLPEMRNQFGTGVDEALDRLATQASEADAYLNQQAAPLTESIVSQSANWVELDCERLKCQPPILIRQFLTQIWSQQRWPVQAMTFQWWHTIAEAIVSEDTKKVLNLPGSIRCEKTGARTIFTATS